MYMPEKKINELLRKYLEGTATPEEQKLVDDWYNSLSTDKEKVQLSDAERSWLRATYWYSLKEEIRAGSSKRRYLWPGFIAAASAAAIVVMTFLFVPAFRPGDSRISGVNSPSDMTSIVNKTGVIREVKLPDGSLARLSPGSVIEINERFNAEDRKIHLSGQAYFDILRDEAKPFYVFANEVVTKVLGTSFSVTAYPEDGEITVAVRSGKVSVYMEGERFPAIPEQEKIILIPNQQAIYNKSERKVLRTLVEEPQVVISEEEVRKIRFEGVAVSEIFKALEKMYGVEIDFEEERFSACFITTSVTGKDLYERIDVICEITGATYTLEDTRIRISGAGCN